MPRILIIEDETDLARLLAWRLEQAGHVPLVAGTGAEALRVIPSFRPEAILLDVILPDIIGFGLCEILRRLSATRDVPIVLVTGCRERESVQLGLEAGADDYVTKPFSPAALLARLDRLLATSDRASPPPRRQAPASA